MFLLRSWGTTTMKQISSTQLFVLENIDNGVAVIENGVITYANLAIYEIFDIKNQNIIGRKIIDVFPLVKENNDFYQIFVDTIQNKHKSIKKLIPYFDSYGIEKTLKICAKYIKKDNFSKPILVAVISNQTEISRVNNIFARYTSKDIANKILHTDDGDKIGGKKKNVSVLLTDLRGFTAISEHVEPEIISKFISHYFEAMCKIVAKYNGTIIEFLGDGLFAVFGLNDNAKDHALDATAAAVEMQYSMKEINKWNVINGYPKIEMGAAVNTGICMIGNIGSKQHAKFGVLGQPVNFCGRLESYTVGQQIYISQETYDIVKDSVIVDETNQILPKGSDKYITIYSIYGVKGKYNIRYSIDLDTVKHTVKEDNIVIHRIFNKNVSNIDIKAKILGYSTDYIVIKCSEEISLLENVVFEFHGTNYAKMVSEIDGCYTLRYTYLSKEYRDYIKCQFS